MGVRVAQGFVLFSVQDCDGYWLFQLDLCRVGLSLRAIPVAHLVRRSGAFECPLAHVWHFDDFLLSLSCRCQGCRREKEGLRCCRGSGRSPHRFCFDTDRAFRLRVSRVHGMSHWTTACCPRRYFMPAGENSFERVA